MAEQNWVSVQKKTFTRWLNTYLSERMLKCEVLERDLGDGLLLMALLEVISSKQVTPKYNKQPKLKMQKVENLNFCINFLKNEGIKLVNIDGTDIEAGNLRLILGLIWTIILRYQIQVSQEGSAKAELLDWVRSKIPEYNINNFTNDWADGKAIMALAEAVQPGQFNLPSDFSSDAVTNARNGIQSAKDKMQIPDILDAEDMVHNPDELANMTYISYFRDYLDMLSKRQQEELIEKTPVAANCVAYGPGLEDGVLAQEETNFTIEAINVHGRKVPVGGHHFDVSIIGPNGPVEYTLNDNLNGTYNVTYTTDDLGDHVIEVKFKDAHIKNSPYTVTVKPSLPFGSTSSIKFYNFVLQSRDKKGREKKSGGAQVNVSIVDQRSGASSNAEVIDNGDGTYGVSYTLPHSGNYQVSVQLNGTDVQGTPFTQTVA
eukprot:TRINITY_DN83_c0_g1_i1.p1 TRINITY_DN83_c0_g1~~TRINITY_DN83_c0_g1_i1.p1  ORF type:complete len:430 (+),score=103.35 TRINITY_DN83_c0_g1_i1:22-1311(+)